MINAIVLAAGKGTRMKTEMPKCVVPLIKKPMLEYIIDSINKSRVDKKIIVVGYKHEIYEEMFEECFAYQEEQLGTAHAVKMALPYLDEDGISVILPGDAPLIDENLINALIAEQEKTNKPLIVGTMLLDNPFGYGRIIKRGNDVLRIVEEKEATEEEKLIKEVNTGVMVVRNKDLISAIEQVKNDNKKHEYYLTDIVEILCLKKVGSLVLDDRVVGINDLYTLSKVEERLTNEIKKNHMLNGVMISNPNSVTIGIDAVIEEGVTIYQGCIITGKTVIKKGAIIGPYSELHNASIMENALIRQSVVYDSTVCENAKIGPFTHLRMNTIVGKNDRIGNFVEIKNSVLGENTNSAHLSYLGDSIIGSKVNVGCGSITVNYDGKAKHKTIVGDNVFIGCNSNLIAPITIGSNTFIAAGSTICDDIPDGAFAIARNRQVTKEEYAKKYKK